ncbi:class I SAM-dependent methyltransferase [Paraburkholderia sp. SUR17]|uniref:class I SAM-dependent methyltransferase n=1 Tax=Paraburkholderia sp. SUR17 TaxID=3034358 RepID=UPI0024088991|nr:class I SAM-dependent methyltransferase [Paraburkholderia sp. SUR17]WEY37301.1 class I SAM-dependent methyltransferase [Paraburkholderia sp. SUR17]
MKDRLKSLMNRFAHREEVVTVPEPVGKEETGMIFTIEELDRKMAECHAAAAISDAAMRRAFTTFRMAPTGTDLDPFGKEYAKQQMALYEGIAGKPYRLQNEAYPHDIAQLDKPFPYSTGAPEVIGGQYLAIGSLIRRLHVSAPARIVEFGAGWGNMALALAQSGYEVTAVDIEKGFTDLIRRRATQMDLPVQTINADFMWAETAAERFDAVVFFECFHHCADHPRLLRALHRIVRPEGRVYFVGEPIEDRLPVPWGVRLDGESLWAIRQHGWLELGFQETYFREILRRTGWNVVRYASTEYAAAHVWVATAIR